MTNQKYFKVVAKCGHVGKRFYIPIQFAVKAKDGKEAAKIARDIPRVKHNHKDAILQVKEISYYEYCLIDKNNKNDPYLQCKSKSEQQKLTDLASRMVEDPHFIKISRYDKIEKANINKYKQEKKRIKCNFDWREELNDFAY